PQSCSPGRQYYGTCGSQCGTQRKTTGGTQGSGARSVARSGSLECSQPRQRACLERDGGCGSCPGSDASVSGGARTQGLRGRLCDDGPTAPQRPPRPAGCPNPSAPKTNHRLRFAGAAPEHVCREGVGAGGRSDVLWGQLT